VGFLIRGDREGGKMEQQDNNVLQNKNWFKTNAKWLAIIAVLVLIIIIGSVKIIIASPGKMSAKVESFKPTGEVPQTTNFSIEFSQDMVLDKSVGIQTDIAPIVFTPPITGKYRWTARHILEFFPNVMLLPSTRYTAEILSKRQAEI
jgi:hypothetical protein